jgi:esterase/lipase superfamily enzyme
LLASALARLRARHPELDREALQRRYRLGDVIFVASDVDLKTFARDQVQPALDLSRQVIVYFSTADRALGFSAMVAGVSRLGQPDISDLTVGSSSALPGTRAYRRLTSPTCAARMRWAA